MVVYFEAFATLCAYSGQNIGRALLHQAERYTRKFDRMVIWLDYWPENAAQVRYYQRNGRCPAWPALRETDHS
ncbi:GNAT family N-acetyltransferase [Ktedonosporobacter rubrisoli]|uniref:GNAT family N-acetyltransferase n=1 Tax=Ktedonosporobacter rubrisoli TaxID=2509675 RepID=A0A4P6JY46_KTERU|nr:GNAT family N-acetyltransferase [Ktedonosporobacter rubrisoli]QBD80709.1 GNAT family N-acetyltransferase [Ktedonosporobacter rubrisoli]